MALEVRVQNEITAYQPKVMWGMSWRQLAAAGVALPVIGGVYAWLWVAGQSDIGMWVVALLSVPIALYGWVRPKGLPFEAYARYVLAGTLLEKQRVFFESTPVFAVDRGVTTNGNNGTNKHRASKKAGGRAERRHRF